MLHKGLSGILKATHIQLIEHRFANPFKRFAYFLKQKILNLHNTTLPYPYSHLFTGLIFGEDGTALPEEMKQRYKLTGLSHLLVVSGSQVSLLSGIVFQVLLALGLRRWKGFLAIGIVNTIFYFVTGGGASIFRAIVMNLCMVFSKLFFYKLSPLTVISFSGLIMMLLNPLVIYDVGAQLSFLATCSLVYGVDYVSPLLPKKLHSVIKTALAMSLSPFIFTTPLLWFHFHTISLVSLLSNLLVVNMIEFLVVVGFFSTLIGLIFYPLGYVLNQACLGIIWVLEWSTQWLSQLPFAEVVVPLHAGLLLVLYLFIGFSGYCIQHNKLKILQKGFVSFLLIFGLGAGVWWFKPQPLTITFLDVGQGDCTVIQTPENKVIVIDTGGLKLNRHSGTIDRYSATRTLMPFLTYIGKNSIDVLITTHYDLDHIGGLFPLLKYKNIDHYIDNGRLAKTPPVIQRLVHDHISTHTPITSPRRLALETDTSLTFLMPIEGVMFDSKNNNSVVILLEHQDLKVLFTGDLESEAEQRLVDYYASQLDADVFKLGHHGSNTSSTLTLLEDVTPQIGIVSAGQYNRYGHPHPDVLSRFKRLGIPLYRTDTQGAIQLFYSNNRLFVSPFLRETHF
jgi:competence protein ComEC